ncbi:MAG: hypothetical protein V4582_23665 [Pseudomonadota bacterium]
MSAILLTACASVRKQPIAAADLATLKQETLANTSRAKPSFVGMTAGNAAFALVGALAAISSGNDLIAANKVADPADAIAQGLANSLAATHQTRSVAQRVAVSADDAAAVAAAAKPNARLVLDVQTLGWGFNYFPTDWTHYRVMYSAKARLIDTRDAKVLAEGFCNRMAQTNEGAPNYEELTANEASGLKQQLAQAASACVASLGAEMFMLNNDQVMAAPLAAQGGAEPATRSVPNPPSLGVVQAQEVAAAPASVSTPVAAPAPQAAAAPAQERTAAPAAGAQVTPLAAIAMAVPMAPAPAADQLYQDTLKQVRASHAVLDPSSHWYKQNVLAWVYARQAEFMETGLSASAALRRAVAKLDHD